MQAARVRGRGGRRPSNLFGEPLRPFLETEGRVMWLTAARGRGLPTVGTPPPGSALFGLGELELAFEAEGVEVLADEHDATLHELVDADCGEADGDLAEGLVLDDAGEMAGADELADDCLAFGGGAEVADLHGPVGHVLVDVLHAPGVVFLAVYPLVGADGVV